MATTILLKERVIIGTTLMESTAIHQEPMCPMMSPMLMVITTERIALPTTTQTPPPTALMMVLSTLTTSIDPRLEK